MLEELRTQIQAEQANLLAASQEQLPHEAYLHRARLEDLIDLATRHGFDVSGWIDRSLLTAPKAD